MSVSLESLLVLEVAEAEGSDSITASARSEMKEDVHPVLNARS